MRTGILGLLLGVGSLLTAAPLLFEQDGFVAFEIESIPAPGKWMVETELKGFSGESYYTWRGPDLMSSPGQGIMEFRLRISRPGKYMLILRNRHEHEDHTLENDCWTKMDDGPWIKTYSSIHKQWTWHSHHEHHNGPKKPASYQLAAGEHIFKISARSKGFSIDRVHLYHVSREKDKKVLDPRAADSLTRLIGPGPYSVLKKYADQAGEGKDLGRLMDKLRRITAAGRETLSAGTAAPAEAALLLEALEKFARTWLDTIKKEADKDPVGTVNALDDFIAIFKGDDLAGEALEFRKEFTARPEVKKELQADRLWQAIEKYKAQLQAHKGKHDLSDADYRTKNRRTIAAILMTARKITIAYPDTRTAKQAHEAIEAYSR